MSKAAEASLSSNHDLENLEAPPPYSHSSHPSEQSIEAGPSRPAFAPPPVHHASHPHTPPTPLMYEPTTVPTPGQPLLRNGRILIFKVGREGCRKCYNSGYKAYDPNNPCTKCWDKYGVPFTAAVRNSPGFGQFGIPTMQTPLPALGRQQPQQPQYYGHYQPVQSPPPQTMYPGQVHQMYPQHPPPQQPMYPTTYAVNGYPQTHYGGPPPQSNHLILPPGDPRIGGYLCQQCNGKGSTGADLFLIDTRETCWICRGSGRVFG